MIKTGFEFAIGVIAAYEVYSLIRVIVKKIFEMIIKCCQKIVNNKSIFSKYEIERLRKYAPDEIKPICKTRPIGFTADLDK